ncbi:hypothetical protein JTE90_016323 [Oedothorax gibbosus]|uniref:RING-type domain-containing protein n=1 Tax=Oedothorax gibbosus TaxID=931172 RepID=A0AAV6TQA3_9ARAC|nr:hypothetical protein JTE90_016323 [Oedothorax gibbosus]
MAYKFKSRADLFGFTEYMIMCSKVLQAVDIDDGSDLVEPRHVVNFLAFVSNFNISMENIFARQDLIWNPFSDLAADLLENLAKKYTSSRVPVIHFLWKDFLLPKVYNLLRLSWPTTCLTREQMETMASQLKGALYCHTWPDSFFETAEECMICMNICITTKQKMICGHWGCEECIMRWLKVVNSCPFCRGVIFSDLNRNRE